jgi:hypothetical protein
MQFARRSRASIFTRDSNAPSRRSAIPIPSSPVGYCAHAHHRWINGTPGSLCQHPAFSARAGRNRNRDAGDFAVGAGTLRLLLHPPILASPSSPLPGATESPSSSPTPESSDETAREHRRRVVSPIGRITPSLNVRSLGGELPRIFECVDCVHIFVAPDRFDSRKAQRESTRMARARLD